MSQCDEGWITEQDLAVLLGVERAVLKKMRPHLLAGEVGHAANQAVIWKKTAAARVAIELGLTLPDGLAPEPQKTMPPLPIPPTGVETVTVLRGAQNVNIVICTRASGEEINVRVVDNKKYVPVGLDGKPMMFEARKNDEGSWWNLVGREPRWRGKF